MAQCLPNPHTPLHPSSSPLEISPHDLHLSFCPAIQNSNPAGTKCCADRKINKAERLGIGKHAQNIQVQEGAANSTFLCHLPSLLRVPHELRNTKSAQRERERSIGWARRWFPCHSTCKNYSFFARSNFGSGGVAEEFALRAKFPNCKWQSRMRGRASMSSADAECSEPNSPRPNSQV